MLAHVLPACALIDAVSYALIDAVSYALIDAVSYARAGRRQDYASLPQKPLVDDDDSFHREADEDDKFQRAIVDMGFLYASVNTAVIEQRDAALPASLPHGLDSLPATAECPNAMEAAHQLSPRDLEMARALRCVLVKAKKAEQPKDNLNLRKCKWSACRVLQSLFMVSLGPTRAHGLRRHHVPLFEQCVCAATHTIRYT